MSLIEADPVKCNKCGACAAVCPVRAIAMNDSGPCEFREQNCIACGHCTAICPTGALDNRLAPLKDQTPADRNRMPGAEAADYLIRSRRSIRNFNANKVPHELISRILDTAHYSPTAGNTDGISFIVIDNEELLKKIINVTARGIEELLSNDPPLPILLSTMLGQFRREGVDTILRGAPCMVLTLIRRELAPSFRENGRFLISYAELYAHSLGLGCCRTGLIDVCVFAGYKPLMDLLQIPADKVLCGSFVLGFPKYEFQRLPDRGKAKVQFID